MLGFVSKLILLSFQMSKRKHTPISLEKKKEIIDAAAKNNNQTKLSEQFKIEENYQRHS
jgi:hypothetical protein